MLPSIPSLTLSTSLQHLDKKDTQQCLQTVERREEEHIDERAPSPPSEVKQSGIVVMHRPSVGRSQGMGDQVWRMESRPKASDERFQFTEPSVGSGESSVWGTDTASKGNDNGGDSVAESLPNEHLVKTDDCTGGQQTQQPQVWCVYTTIEITTKHKDIEETVEVTHQLEQEDEAQEELELEIEEEEEVVEEVTKPGIGLASHLLMQGRKVFFWNSTPT